MPPRTHVTFTSVSDDGLRLLLVTDRGVELTLDITPTLRAALRGDASRIGQLEIPMESALRPRDIQARIRAGESPEAVAQAARTTVEKIMPFAGPVLAERAHVAQRAQRSMLRRRAGETPAPSRQLGDAVEAHLRSLNVDPAAVEWDAWRREDGRWSLLAVYTAGATGGTAEFTFDAPGNYVHLDNDDAHWLVGDGATVGGAGSTPELDDLETARRRRLSSVARPSHITTDAASDELPLGVDVIEMVTETADTADGPTASTSTDVFDPCEVDSPLEAFLDVSPSTDDAELRAEAAEAMTEDREPEEPVIDPAPAPARAEPPGRRPAKKKGRASVPSWDEIMFGGGDQ